MQSKDMPGADCASRAAVRASNRQARRTVKSIEGEDGRVADGPCEDGGCRIVRRRPALWRRGYRYSAAVAGGAVTAHRAVLAVRAAVGGMSGLRGEGGLCGESGVRGVRRGRFAGRCIGSQRQRGREEEREQELR